MMELRYEKCPACGHNMLPGWNPQGKETARACQKCGYVQMRPNPEVWEKERLTQGLEDAAAGRCKPICEVDVEAFPCRHAKEVTALREELLAALEPIQDFIKMTRLRDFSGLSYEELIESQFNVGEEAKSILFKLEAVIARVKAGAPAREDHK
jgi:DNA-directed RNA polymerase subunit M/transcription elongation factor TFIIS